MRAFQSHRLELIGLIERNLRGWEQRIVVTPQKMHSQILDPIYHYLADLSADGEKVRGEGLAEFDVYFSGILLDATSGKVDGV